MYKTEIFDLYPEFALSMTKIFTEIATVKKLAVAVSGGCDSMALTFLLRQFCIEKNIELVALTVNHQMRIDASLEVIGLAKIMRQHNIQHHILKIESQQLPTSNIEAKLRDLRYELLLNFCHQNQIDAMLLGHHLNDVAENFLIRLFRGSGLDGLSTMAEKRMVSGILLARPLLNFTKSQLKNFLNLLGINWFEDESNSDDKFLRNKIRKIFTEFPNQDLIAKRVKSASDEISKTRDLFDEIMISWQSKIIIANSSSALAQRIDAKAQEPIDHKSCKSEINENLFLLLNRQELTICPKSIALKILALALMQVGGRQYKPRLSKLQNFYQYLINQQSDQIKPRTLYGCIASSISPNLIQIKCEILV